MALSCERVRELASGFVLGALEPAEMAAVREHLAGCEQPHTELAEFGGTVSYLAVTPAPVEPPAWLRGSIIAAAKADLQAGRRVGKSTERRTLEPAAAATPAVAVAAPEAARTMVAPEPGVISLDAVRGSRSRRAVSWITRVAAVVAVVALGGYAISVQADLNKAARDRANAQSFLYVISQWDTRTTPLVNSDGSQAGGVAALRPNGHIVVNMNHLAPVTGDETYMVWLTGADSVVVKVGTFTVGDDGKGYLEVDNVPTTSRVWITVCREPNDKVTKPTGPTILSGTISF